MAEVKGTWKCVSLKDTDENTFYLPEKIFIEIRDVRIYKEIETHIDIADYNESLLMRGKISNIVNGLFKNSITVDITFPEKICLTCDFSVGKQYLKMKWYGKNDRTLKMVLIRQTEHLF